MNIVALSSIAPQDKAQPNSRQVVQAAHEFEAMLLHALLGSLQQSFASLPGEEKKAGSGEYEYLGTQALATGLANSGGLGIAQMVIRDLTRNRVGTHVNTFAEE